MPTRPPSTQAIPSSRCSAPISAWPRRLVSSCVRTTHSRARSSKCSNIRRDPRRRRGRVRRSRTEREHPEANVCSHLYNGPGDASTTTSSSPARASTTSRTSRDAAARRAVGHHRPVGLGQVVAGVRHDLRRGPAPLRRVAVRLRAPVPRADGQARRRLDRGPVAGDLDRPEDDVAQPALDGRHGHRDLRLPAPAVSRVGQPHCHICGAPIAGQSAEQIVDQVMELEEGTRFMVLAPIVRGRKGEYGKLLRGAARRRLRARAGRRRAARCSRSRSSSTRSSSTTSRSSSTGSSCATTCASASPTRSRRRSRWPTAIVEIELRAARRRGPPGATLTFSEHFACPKCGTSMPELEPRIFSFNSPHGACERCTGLGSQLEIDPELIVPDPSLSIAEGALAPWAVSVVELLRADHRGDRRALRHRPRGAVGRAHRGRTATCSCTAPTASSSQVTYRNRYGRKRSYATRFEGVVPNLERRYRETDSEFSREKIEEYMTRAAVPGVQGRAAAAGVARGARRRHRDPRVHARCRCARR